MSPHLESGFRQLIHNLYVGQGVYAEDIFTDLFFDLNPRPIELKRLKEICLMFDNDPAATETYLEGKKDYHKFAGRPRMMNESAQNYLR